MLQRSLGFRRGLRSRVGIAAHRRLPRPRDHDRIRSRRRSPLVHGRRHLRHGSIAETTKRSRRRRLQVGSAAAVLWSRSYRSSTERLSRSRILLHALPATLLPIIPLQRIRHSGKLRVQIPSLLLTLPLRLRKLLLLHARSPLHLHRHLVSNLLEVLHVLLVPISTLLLHAGLCLSRSMLAHLSLFLLLLPKQHLHLRVHVLDHVLRDVALVGTEEMLQLLLVLGAHLEEGLLLLLVVGVDLVVRVACGLLHLRHLVHELRLLGQLRVLLRLLLLLLAWVGVHAAVGHLRRGDLLLHVHAVLLIAAVAHGHASCLRHTLLHLLQLLRDPSKRQTVLLSGVVICILLRLLPFGLDASVRCLELSVPLSGLEVFRTHCARLSTVRRAYMLLALGLLLLQSSPLLKHHDLLGRKALRVRSHGHHGRVCWHTDCRATWLHAGRLGDLTVAWHRVRHRRGVGHLWRVVATTVGLLRRTARHFYLRMHAGSSSWRTSSIRCLLRHGEAALLRHHGT